jgi:TolB-like protein/Tfp pilus assembly protein PilF
MPVWLLPKAWWEGILPAMMEQDDLFGPFVLDRSREALLRNGSPIAIGHRGCVLLSTLLDARGEVVSKTVLMERTWPGVVVEEANLAVQIGALRKAMGTEGETLIITVPRVGYRLLKGSTEPAGGVAVRGPSIAVLPFSNMSGDLEQEYFADGVVDEIITALSRFKYFAVAARNSSFVYKGRALDVRQIAKELGVRYVVEGSIRRSGDRLRVIAQLIDSDTGAHIWAEKFDGEPSDIFAFQDSITESVVGLIEPEIRKAEIARARRKRPESLEAYDLFLKALPLVYGMEVEGYLAAMALLERAIELDSRYALATAYAAWSVEKLMARDYLRGPEATKQAVSLAHQALATGRDDPVVAGIAGWVLYSIGEESSGLEMLRGSVSANPNNLVTLNLAGVANAKAGDLEAASTCYRRAYRLSPGAPDAFWALTGLGFAELERGNDEAALKWFEQSLATSNDWPFTYFGIVAANALLGRLEEAQTALAKLLDIAPQTTLRSRSLVGGECPRTREGLRLAGLPE